MTHSCQYCRVGRDQRCCRACPLFAVQPTLCRGRSSSSSSSSDDNHARTIVERQWTRDDGGGCVTHQHHTGLARWGETDGADGGVTYTAAARTCDAEMCDPSDAAGRWSHTDKILSRPSPFAPDFAPGDAVSGGVLLGLAARMTRLTSPSIFPRLYDRRKTSSATSARSSSLAREAWDARSSPTSVSSGSRMCTSSTWTR